MIKIFHRKLTDVDRFWKYVIKSECGCWDWSAHKDKDGYGTLIFNHKGGKRAHRISWMIHFGEIPVGLEVLHKCDNPSCTRPDHLFLGTQADNIRDRDAKGRRPSGSGEKSTYHKLTQEQVDQIRKDYDPHKVSFRELAEKYGVTDSNIGCIVRNDSWKETVASAKPSGRITLEQASIIRQDYAENPVQFKILAAKYGVSRYVISGVIRNETWKEAGI